MELHNLREADIPVYTTWGCMWEKGRCQEETEYVCHSIKTDIGGDRQKDEVPIQSRITAYWPDGSVKWTAHTACAALLGGLIEVLPGKPAAIAGSIGITETDGLQMIRAGRLEITRMVQSDCLFEQISYDGKSYVLKGHPVLILEEPVMIQGRKGKIEKKYSSCIHKVTLEDAGELQVIVKYEGCHRQEDGERKLPFIIRMKIGLDSSQIDFMHTFLYDGDEDKDYLKGLGIRMQIPVQGAMYNRHIKFTTDHGMFHESMVHLISWRPKIHDDIYRSQMKGEKIIPTGDDEVSIGQMMQDVPFFSEYDFCQISENDFRIRKKMKEDNCCYLDCLHGRRSEGGVCLGSEYGSVSLAIRDFWEKYPSGYTFRNLDGDMAEADIWFWSPTAEAMDFRHYANRGYNQVCYEGYDYKGATPYGIACTNECSLRFSDELIAPDTSLRQFTRQVRKPPFYVGNPEYYHKLKAFGRWSLPSYQTDMENWLEEQLDLAVTFYQTEVEQRNWYGMFNYGDFMHTYDKERHVWRYDMGGYAWDNTELVPTLWLWIAFLRSGREDIFELAEKLTRHTSEVDVYHMGPYKGLGSRHNVRHWGCPCKEARIAMASHHRYYYYLTGDPRMGDIFNEWKDNEMSFLNKDPLGDFYKKEDMILKSHARTGPDWSSLCANWMTGWERFRDNTYRDKILTGLGDIKKAPLKLISGMDFEFDPQSCHLRYIGEKSTGGTHLQICMGAPQIWMEMADLLEDEEWKQMMAEYGRFYFLPADKQLEESKGLIGDKEFTLSYMAAAMGAYAAAYLKEDWLKTNIWQILLKTMLQTGDKKGFLSYRLSDTGNRKSLMEIPWISTNFAAQWCLNVIMVLEFIRESLPETLEEACLVY